MRRGILIGYMGFRRVGLFVVVVVFCCCCCCFCCSWPFFSTSLSTRVTDWRARRGVPAISGQLCHVRRRLASSTAAVAACGSVPATKKTQVSFFFFGRGGGMLKIVWRSTTSFANGAVADDIRSESSNWFIFVDGVDTGLISVRPIASFGLESKLK